MSKLIELPVTMAAKQQGGLCQCHQKPIWEIPGNIYSSLWTNIHLVSVIASKFGVTACPPTLNMIAGLSVILTLQ